MKYLLILLFSISLLNASFLFDKNYPLCIEDYYSSGGSIYYLRSSDNVWASTTEDNVVGFIIPSYKYENGNCIPLGLNTLGLTNEQYQFLLALCGLIFGGVFLFFTVDVFVKVGGKR